MKCLRHLVLGTGLILLTGCESSGNQQSGSNNTVTAPATVIAYTPAGNHAPTDTYITVPIDDVDPEILLWLSWQKVHLEKDPNGDARVYDSLECRRALVQLRRLLKLRCSVTADNIANANTTHDDRGEVNPYRRKFVAFDAKGNVEVKTDPSPFRQTYEPGNPDADAKGYVKYPNVEPMVESLIAKQTSTEYNLVAYMLSKFDPSYPPTDHAEANTPARTTELQSAADSH